MNRAAVDMTAGRPLPQIVLFSLPVMLGSVFQQLYTVVDGIVVGRSISTNALAAVGVGFPVTYMLISVFLGLGLGASVLVSQQFGRGDLEGVRRTARAMNTFLLVSALPLTLFGILTAGPFLRLLGTGADIFADARLYMAIYYVGLLPQFGYNLCTGVLQGIGDSRTPLYVLIASSVLHVALAVLFVAVIPLGVAGVAWSTVLSQLFSWVLSIHLINRRYPEIKTPLFTLKLDRAAFAATMKIGLPIGLQNALFSIGMMAMQPLINGASAAFIAGYNSAVRIDGFVFIPVSALASAVTTFAGQNIGAGRFERLRQGARGAVLLSLALCAAMSAAVVPLRGALMGLFSAESAVVAAGGAYLLRVIPLYPVFTLQLMLVGIIRGGGQTVVPTAATLLSLLLARVPAAYLLTRALGYDNMHWCYAIGWALGLAILIPYYCLKWRKQWLCAAKEDI